MIGENAGGVDVTMTDLLANRKSEAKQLGIKILDETAFKYLVYDHLSPTALLAVIVVELSFGVTDIDGAVSFIRGSSHRGFRRSLRLLGPALQPHLR